MPAQAEGHQSELGALRSTMETANAQHVAAREADRAMFVADLQDVKTQMNGVATDLGEQIRVSVQALQASQAQQQLQMQSSLEEIKAFLKDPHKKQRTGHDAD